jgi:histidine triad (HIT) family protein
MSCIFCRIVAGEIPSKSLTTSDERLLAFHDVNPQAPVHLLVIPRRHITNLLELGPDDDGLVGAMVRQARDIARELGLGERGFRLVLNCGDDAGYSVHHIHLHLLGGRPLGWPPG